MDAPNVNLKFCKKFSANFSRYILIFLLGQVSRESKAVSVGHISDTFEMTNL